MEDKKTYNIIKWALIGVVALIVLLVINPFVAIPAGHRGVVLEFQGVTGRVFDEGLHFRTPFIQTVKKIDVRTVKLEVKTFAYSKDIQTVDAEIALNYHVNPEGVAKLYQEVGMDYEARVIVPAIQESIKEVSAQYTAQQLIEERSSVKDGIQTSLANRLAKTNITVDEFSITDFAFSDQYESIVEEKQVAQQAALKAQNDLERVEFEAQQRIEQAKAEAEAIRIQAQAITQQGGRDYVELKAVEKWNGELPTQMIPGGTVPFLNLTN